MARRCAAEQLRHVHWITHAANDPRTALYTDHPPPAVRLRLARTDLSGTGETDYGKIPRIIFHAGGRLAGGLAGLRAGEGAKRRRSD